MTRQRTAIFKPLGLELTRQIEAAMGRTPEDAGSVDPPPRPPEAKEVIESKTIPCECCGRSWLRIRQIVRLERTIEAGTGQAVRVPLFRAE